MAKEHTIALGKPEQGFQDIFDVCVQCHEEGFKKMRPGQNQLIEGKIRSQLSASLSYARIATGHLYVCRTEKDTGGQVIGTRVYCVADEEGQTND